MENPIKMDDLGVPLFLVQHPFPTESVANVSDFEVPVRWDPSVSAHLTSPQKPCGFVDDQLGVDTVTSCFFVVVFFSGGLLSRTRSFFGNMVKNTLEFFLVFVKPTKKNLEIQH